MVGFFIGYREGLEATRYAGAAGTGSLQGLGETKEYFYDLFQVNIYH